MLLNFLLSWKIIYCLLILKQWMDMKWCCTRGICCTWGMCCTRGMCQNDWSLSIFLQISIEGLILLYKLYIYNFIYKCDICGKVTKIQSRFWFAEQKQKPVFWQYLQNEALETSYCFCGNVKVKLIYLWTSRVEIQKSRIRDWG